ncbi:hypothetical protein GCM10010358_12730 [Streptomyces minutiscleroticus]|uniref:Lipoprotein n=1 Tax=Streptomyces minutiscleroticus TaxID=68238 RepID=A0A918NDQ6_9ACTN|nr:hypothetical protein [Streptomyces minutiscleroticus]GGX59693.1 hypothetical protein GCM10010358_12730 [Streptomyces minutiscleroticus]
MISLRARTVLVAAAVVAGALSTAACQNDDTARGAAQDGTASVQAAADKDGVGGTFAGGQVTYLAPGKYTVTTRGRTQQFWLAEDTKIWGAGRICGDAGGQAASECTEAELEKAAKAGAVPADVVMEDGRAVTVTERPAADGGGGDGSSGSGDGSSSDGGNGSSSGDGSPSGGGADTGEGKGVSGTWLGTVSYLAPGKYTVSDLKDTEQQFWLGEDTEIWGAGGICGDADGQAAQACTEAELETAAKAGTLAAEVRISDGIATRITEER